MSLVDAAATTHGLDAQSVAGPFTFARCCCTLTVVVKAPDPSVVTSVKTKQSAPLVPAGHSPTPVCVSAGNPRPRTVAL
jgi:hypothetical protein